MTERHARALKKIPQESDRASIGQRVFEQQLSARETETIVRNICAGLEPAGRPARGPSAWQSLEGARLKCSSKALLVEVQSADPRERITILRRLLDQLERELGGKEKDPAGR